jgi:hypothetical protein
VVGRSKHCLSDRVQSVLAILADTTHEKPSRWGFLLSFGGRFCFRSAATPFAPSRSGFLLASRPWRVGNGSSPNQNQKSSYLFDLYRRTRLDCWGLSGLGWYGEGWLTYPISLVVAPSPIPQTLRVRILFDAIGIWLGVTLGFRLLLSFVTREGLAAVRMQTELSLAHGIQATLVPTLETPSFEVYGKSIPSTEMGGDLIDVIESDGSLLAYVADISGHGLPAGQLMGMLKAALRVSLQFHQQPVALLESADRVLPAVKEPDMYATLALLYFDSSAQAEYALAGAHPALSPSQRRHGSALHGAVPLGSDSRWTLCEPARQLFAA